MKESKTTFQCKKCGKKITSKLYFIDGLCNSCTIKFHKQFLEKRS